MIGGPGIQRYAYAVLGTTADDSREINCYFDTLSAAVDYHARTVSWGWSCKVYRIRYQEVEEKLL